MAIFVPESYKREIFTKRSIAFLVEVLSLLFVACIYAPFGYDAYICPNTETTNNVGGGLLQPPATTFLGLVVWYLTESILGCVTNAMWLWPGGYFLWSLYDLTGNIVKTRQFHEKRLFELEVGR